MTHDALGGQGHAGARPWTASAAYALAALAGGYGLAWFLWAVRHPAWLPDLILANELPAGARPALLWALLLGMAAALAAWAAAGLLARRRGQDASLARARAGVLLATFGLLAWPPLLALPGIQKDWPFFTLALIGSLALAGFLCANQTLRLWSPALAPQSRRARPAPGPAGAAAPPATNAGSSLRRRPVSRAAGALLLVLLLVLAYFAFMSVLTVARHNAYLTHAFDLGIHDQVVYNALHAGYLRSTQHGAQAINYLREHFAPILYLLAPLYAIYPDARTLLVLQSLLLALGALPVYLLAHRKTGSLGLAVALAASYLLFPALQGINTFDFHQVAPATVLLLFSLYFLETDRLAPFLVTLGLAMLAKEEVALTAAAIGVYALLAKRRYRLGALVTAVSLAYFVTVVAWIMPALGGGAQVNRFEGLMAPGTRGFGGVFKTVLTNPVFVLNFIVSNPAKLLYLGQLFLPVCGLPLLAGAGWLVALPALGMALLSSAETQYTIGYHYPATLVPGIYFLAVLGAARLDPSRYRRLAVAAAVLLAGLACNYEYGWLWGRNFSGFPQPTPHQQALTALLQEVPRDASVSSLSDLVPHLSNRANVYLFPIVNDADYLALDTDPKANFWPFVGATGRSDAQQAIAPYLTSGRYGLVDARDGGLLLRRGAATTRNPEGLQALFGARFEAEDLPGNYGRRNLADPAASGGQARVGQPDLPHEAGKNALVYGPYDTLSPGKYRVIFWLKLAGPPAAGKVATLDVFSNTAGGELAATDVTAADFKPGGQYQPFAVDLETGQTWTDLEYRVVYENKGQLWVDRVEIVPVRVVLSGADQPLDLSGS